MNAPLPLLPAIVPATTPEQGRSGMHARWAGKPRRVSPEAKAAAAAFDRMCAARPLKPPAVAIVGVPRTAGQIALASEQRRERRRNGYA